MLIVPNIRTLIVLNSYLKRTPRCWSIPIFVRYSYLFRTLIVPHYASRSQKFVLYSYFIRTPKCTTHSYLIRTSLIRTFLRLEGRKSHVPLFGFVLYSYLPCFRIRTIFVLNSYRIRTKPIRTLFGTHRTTVRISNEFYPIRTHFGYTNLVRIRTKFVYPKWVRIG